jgi:hypothetical protein
MEAEVAVVSLLIRRNLRIFNLICLGGGGGALGGGGGGGGKLCTVTALKALF